MRATCERPPLSANINGWFIFMTQFLPLLFMKNKNFKTLRNSCRGTYTTLMILERPNKKILHDTPSTTLCTFAEPSRQWFPACKLNELPRQKSHSMAEFIVFILHDDVKWTVYTIYTNLVSDHAYLLLLITSWVHVCNNF